MTPTALWVGATTFNRTTKALKLETEIKHIDALTGFQSHH